MASLPTPPGPGKGPCFRGSRKADPESDDRPDPSDRVWLWSPTGFEPEAILPPDLRRYGDCLRYFLHKIHHSQVFDRSLKGGFVPLKAAYMRKYFPGDDVYKRVRDCMIERGAIVCDDRYVKGKKSYGYVLGPDLAAMRQHRVEVSDRTLARKLRANREDWAKTPQGVHRHLLHNLRNLEIDYPAALEWMLVNDFDPVDETSAQMIRDGEFFMHVCAYGRVHSNLSNLRRGLRNFLTHGGSPLVNLDIRNSQPLVFGILLRERFRAQSMPPDVKLYLDLVEEGVFYDDLMDKWGWPAERRGEFKGKFFGHVLYCKAWPETAAASEFGRMYPNVYQVIMEAKARDYADFAKAMQRAESDIVIGKVAVRCMNEMPRATLLTIHDSIVTTHDHADNVRSIMLEEFAKAGLKPSIQIENLKPPQFIRQL